MRTPQPSTAAVARYFESLFESLIASPAFGALGREVYGDAFCYQLGYAGAGEISRLVELAAIRRGHRVLDLCAGAGGMTTRIEALMGSRPVAFDCAPPRLSDRAIVGAAETWPFRGGSLDAVVCIDGFSYATGLLLDETARVLKPRARFAFLLSLKAGDAASFIEDLKAAGMRSVFTEAVTDEAIAILTRLEAGYRRHKAALEVEVGARLYRGLRGEVSILLRGLRAGTIERLFLFGER